MNVCVHLICIIIIVLIILLIVYKLIGYKLEYFKITEGINKLDSIVYINLENRADRKELLMKELESINTDMSKVQKVNGVFIPNFPNAWSYILSKSGFPIAAAAFF